MASAECPSCDSRVIVGNSPRIGHRVTCSTCDAALEVVWLNPLELDWVYDEEDFDDYGLDYDEDESDYELQRH